MILLISSFDFKSNLSEVIIAAVFCFGSFPLKLLTASRITLRTLFLFVAGFTLAGRTANLKRPLSLPPIIKEISFPRILFPVSKSFFTSFEVKESIIYLLIKLFLPFALRRESVLFPPTLLIFFKKPCVLFLFLLCG